MVAVVPVTEMKWGLSKALKGKEGGRESLEAGHHVDKVWRRGSAGCVCRTVLGTINGYTWHPENLPRKHWIFGPWSQQ